MRTLRMVLVIFCIAILTTCSHRHSSMVASFDYVTLDKATLLDAVFSIDAWLRLHGFSPGTAPASATVAGLRPGHSSPGMTDFWYRGSYHGSMPFFLRISLTPGRALRVDGDIQIEAEEGTDYKDLEARSNDFSNELIAYVLSLKTKPGT